MTEHQFAVTTVFLLALIYFADAKESWTFSSLLRRIHAASGKPPTPFGLAMREKFDAYTISGIVAGVLWAVAGYDAATPEDTFINFEARTVIRVALVAALAYTVWAKRRMRLRYEDVLDDGPG